MRRTFASCITCLLITFLGTFPIFAVETKIDQPSSMSSGQAIELHVTITGAKAGQNFLKAEFFEKDTTEYFGETFNGSDWYSGSDYQNYLPIEVSDSGFEGNVQVRIPENFELDRGGEYCVRIRRFTSSGNYNADEARQSALAVSFEFSSSPSPVPLPDTPTTEPEVRSTFVPSYSLISVNEIYPYPQDSEHEWVEVYNFNDFSVSLENWYIDDIEGGSSPRQFSLIIPAKSYGVVEIPSSMFNNSGDTVRLLDFQKNLKDSILYEDAKSGFSIGRVAVSDQAVCQQSPSKGQINNSCNSPTAKPISTATQKPTPSPFFTSTQASTDETTELSPKATIFPFHILGKTANTQHINEQTSQKTMVLGAATKTDSTWFTTGLYKGLLVSAILVLLTNCGYICMKILKDNGILTFLSIV